LLHQCGGDSASVILTRLASGHAPSFTPPDGITTKCGTFRARYRIDLALGLILRCSDRRATAMRQAVSDAFVGSVRSPPRPRSLRQGVFVNEVKFQRPIAVAPGRQHFKKRPALLLHLKFRSQRIHSPWPRAQRDSAHETGALVTRPRARDGDRVFRRVSRVHLNYFPP